MSCTVLHVKQNGSRKKKLEEKLTAKNAWNRTCADLRKRRTSVTNAEDHHLSIESSQETRHRNRERERATRGTRSRGCSSAWCIPLSFTQHALIFHISTTITSSVLRFIRPHIIWHVQLRKEVFWVERRNLDFPFTAAGRVSCFKRHPRFR